MKIKSYLHQFIRKKKMDNINLLKATEEDINYIDFHE